MIKNKKISYIPTGSFNEMPVEKICETLKTIGYDGIEWTQFFANPDNHTQKDLQKLVDTTHSFELEISEIVVQQDIVVADKAERQDNIRRVLNCIERYSEVGINTINLFTGPCPWIPDPLVIGKNISMGDAWAMVFEAFDQFVALAEKYRINIAVENVWLMLANDFYSAQYLINHYNSPYLGVNFDPSHDILANNTDTGFIIRQWGKERIKHMHLKDAVGIQKLDRFIFPIIGEGNVDWDAFSKATDDIGYEGYMSVEFEAFNYVKRIFKNDWVKAAQISMDNIKYIFDK